MLVIQRPTVEALGEADGNRQRFAVGPLEPGFGHTLGNSLRRTLLSSIPGAADHPGALRRRPPRVRHHRAASPRTSPTSSSTSRTSCSRRRPTSRSRCASTCAARPTSPPATSRRTSDVEILNPDLHIATLNAQGPPRHRPHRRAGPRLPVGRPQQDVDHDDRRHPGRLDLLAGAPGDLQRRAHPRRAVHQLRPPRARHRDRRLDHAREALASAGATLRSLVDLVAEMSDEPQGLELGEVAGAAAGSPDLDLPDRGPRPVRASPQLPQAGPGQHDRRAAQEDRGRPAGHHQLRPEVARRGHRRSSTSAACRSAAEEEDEHACPPLPTQGPPLRRRRRPPAADDGQPGRVADRRRGASSPPRPRPRRCAPSPRR